MEKVKLSIVYYSMTGHNFQMAMWAKEEAEKLGAEVRLRKVEEQLDTTGANPAWQKYLDDSQNVEVASTDDLVWADAILFSAPTRYGVMAAQMKHFLDSTGGPWGEGKLANKLVYGTTGTATRDGFANDLEAAVRHQVTRLLEVTGKYLG